MDWTHTHLAAEAPQTTEHFDVLIVGAGISGVGGAYHLTRQRPGTSFVVLETQGGFGGTWRTHRYPGIRSDSDLYTFGYRFKPWKTAPIATAAEILSYLGEVIDENGLADHIRYQPPHHRGELVEQRQPVDAGRHPHRHRRGRAVHRQFPLDVPGLLPARQGYTPEWPGMEAFQGRIVHPQTWPDDLDYKSQRVVVIGSGATAATLVPAIADDCAHVTLLQRSPTFFRPGATPSRSPRAARAADRRGVDPRDRAPQDPV